VASTVLILQSHTKVLACLPTFSSSVWEIYQFIPLPPIHCNCLIRHCSSASPKARVWRKQRERLKDLVGGQRLHLLVAITQGKGVI